MSMKLISGLPDGVVGVEAAGKVTEDDYKDVLIPAVEAMLKNGGKANLLYVLGAEFEGYQMGAALEDAKFGIGNLSSWRRIAFVTDHDVYRAMAGAIGFVMPGEVKAFPLAKLDDASAWVSA